MNTPVALFIYNRPNKTKTVLQQIRSAEPSQLFIIGDGPTQEEGDYERCRQARAVIESQVDWDCEVHRQYADSNMGLRERFITGLDWLFNQVKKAIILEDDCVPNKSFFEFCSEMLYQYRDDKRVMDITGRNHLGIWKSSKQDYHFSNYGGVWGWATWRRSWESYDPAMELWTSTEAQERMRDVIADDNQYRYLKYIYESQYKNPTTWDYQWGFSRHINSALSIVPSKNLVTNIGFDETATNTTGDELSKIDRHSLRGPYEIRETMGVDRKYDRKFHRLRPITHRYRLLRFLRRILC